MSVFKKKLQQMNGAVQDMAKNFTGNPFATLPDDTYNFRVSAALKEAKASGAVRVAWQFTVDDGEQQGKSAFDGNNLDNQIGINILRYRIEALGYTWPEDISEIEEILNDIVSTNPLISATCKSVEKDGFTNYKIEILEVLENGSGTDDSGTDDAPTMTDDDDSGSDGTDEQFKTLQEICIANDIDLGEQDSLEGAVKALIDSEFGAEEFAIQTVEESDFLREIGLESCAAEAPAPIVNAKKVVKKAPSLKKK